MTTKPVRRAKLSLSYASADISEDISTMLESFDYNDIFDSKSTDDITVVLEDRNGLWRSDWFPSRGAKLTAKLECLDWPGGKVLDCGSFEIDSVRFNGPPNICTIGALAVGVTSAIRREQVTKAWEHITVQEIAQETASKHGFALVYDSSVNPKIVRYDQREQTDMELLGELCDNNGLGIKVSNDSILIYEEKIYDQRAPTKTFTRNADGYISHTLAAESSDIYVACEVKYLDPQERVLITYRHEPGASEWSSEKPPSGFTLKLNQRCECQADAERLAKSALRDQNKREVTGSIVTLGDPDVDSGMVVALKNFGNFDNGKYLVERARHHWDKQGGYESTAEVRGTLDY